MQSTRSCLIITILFISCFAQAQMGVPDIPAASDYPTVPPNKFDGTFDCQKFATKDIGCDKATVVENCKKLATKVPAKSREALDYTLEYFYENHGKLQDPQCALDSDSLKAHRFTPAQAEAGIQSSAFVVRDLGTLHAYKVNSYFVDLCNSDFKAFESNVGTGTVRGHNGLTDVEGDATTLSGAFLTDNKTTRLVPSIKPTNQNYQAYMDLMKTYGDKTRVYLMGLNSSNNSTALGKPFHLTPLQSSSGCPSVNPVDADVLVKLTKDSKNSLLLSYDKKSMQKLGDGATCTNGQGRLDFNGGRPASTVKNNPGADQGNRVHRNKKGSSQ